jgi:HNH endonuclease
VPYCTRLAALDLGRSTRLANRWQRRTLRALYPTCAIPDCPVRFSLCKVHHVRWWRRGGRTDLANLLPVCVRHHTAIHHEGWTLELAADRNLRVTLPDRTVMTTGPPARAA